MKNKLFCRIFEIFEIFRKYNGENKESEVRYAAWKDSFTPDELLCSSKLELSTEYFYVSSLKLQILSWDSVSELALSGNKCFSNPYVDRDAFLEIQPLRMYQTIHLKTNKLSRHFKQNCGINRLSNICL